MARHTNFRSRIHFPDEPRDSESTGSNSNTLDERVSAVLGTRLSGDSLRRAIDKSVATSDKSNDSQASEETVSELSVIERRIDAIKADIDEANWLLARTQAEKLKVLQVMKTATAHEDRVSDGTVRPGAAQNSHSELAPEPLEESAVNELKEHHAKRRSIPERVRALFGQSDQISQLPVEQLADHLNCDEVSVAAASNDSATHDDERKIVVRPCAEDPVAEAEWLASLGRYDAAIEKLDRAKQQSPGRAAFIDALKEVYLVSREFDTEQRFKQISAGMGSAAEVYDDEVAEGAGNNSVEEFLYQVDATPFELVQAYVELEDFDAARTMLKTISKQGGAEDKARALGMLRGFKEKA